MLLARDLPREIFALAKEGDQSSLMMILSSVEPWMRRAIFPYTRNADAEDLMQEARIIALETVKEYDPSRGANFLTFLMPYFIQKLRRTLTLRGLILRPINPRLSDESKALEKNTYNVDSLDAEIPGQDRIGYDVLPAMEPDQEERADAARLREAIDRLNPRLKRIILGRLNADSLEDIGRGIGVSKQRVRQLQLEGMTALRRHLSALEYKRESPERRPLSLYDDYRLTMPMAPNILKIKAFDMARIILLQGGSVRRVRTETGISTVTSCKLRRFFLDKLGPILCGCGKSAGHRGWCSYLYKLSTARQLTMRRMHDQTL